MRHGGYDEQGAGRREEHMRQSTLADLGNDDAKMIGGKFRRLSQTNPWLNNAGATRDWELAR